MITVTINGERVQLETAPTIAELLKTRGYAGQTAVAINGDFVPRGQHAERRLAEKDEIDIVTPMQGG